MNGNSLKIKDLELENFKNLTAMKLEINGRSFVVIGKNEAGKSTLIDAVISPMNKDVLPTEPIKKGEQRARIKETIYGTVNGEKRELVMDLRFTPSNGKGRLKMTNEKGEDIPSPGQVLEGMLGNFSFDIEDFLRGTDAKAIEKRRKYIKQISECEKELDEVDAKIKKTKEDREELNREIKTLDATIYQHGITDEEFQKYSEPCKESPAAIKANLDNLQPNIDKINGFKQKWDKLSADNKALGEKITTNSAKASELNNEIEELKKQIEAKALLIKSLGEQNDKIKDEMAINFDKIQAGAKWLDEHPLPNVKEISDRLEAANTHVRTHEKIKEFEGKQKDLLKKKADSEAMTQKITALDAEKNKIIAASKIPIKGLTYDENGVYYKGLPFESKQINTATKMEIGEEMVMAMNPGLKVIFVRDGSLYDKANLKRLVEKAESRGYQVIVEIVGDNESPEIIWMEEYLNKH